MFPRAAEGLKECKKILKDLKGRTAPICDILPRLYRRGRMSLAREAPGSSASLVEKRHLVLVDLISGFFLGLGGTLLTGTVCAFFHRGQRKVEMLGGLSP